MNPSIGNLSVLSPAHIYRIILILLIIILSSFSNYSFSRKIIYCIIPTILIYFGLIASSFLSYRLAEINNLAVMSLESMTAIALFPLIEIVLSRYYLINSYKNVASLLRIKRNLFKYAVNFIMSLIIFTYLLYLFTQ